MNILFASTDKNTILIINSRNNVVLYQHTIYAGPIITFLYTFRDSTQPITVDVNTTSTFKKFTSLPKQYSKQPPPVVKNPTEFKIGTYIQHSSEEEIHITYASVISNKTNSQNTDPQNHIFVSKS